MVVFPLQGSRFISLADYCAMGHSEVTMKEGDNVELLKVGCAGWWFVKVLGNICKFFLHTLCMYNFCLYTNRC